MDSLNNSQQGRETRDEWRRTDVLVIGGGQAGLAVSRQLATRGVDHLVLDASATIGGAWRNRWDSLRLFTPALYDGLDGMPFPAKRGETPSKDAMADYLQTYAAAFELPVISGARVEHLERVGEDYVATCARGTFVARQVVVAMSTYQVARIPDFAQDLSPSIRQLSAGTYRNPGQVGAGTVLVVGVGNSGAEIAKDLSESHTVVLSGESRGEIPFAFSSFFGRHVVTHLLNRVVFPRILSLDTPIGRRARAKSITQGVILIRVRSKELAASGVRRVARMVGVSEGKPLLDDGSVVDAESVIWCTGFSAGFDWIDLPVLDETGEPIHDRGVIETMPGLYFVGLHFLTSLSSAMVGGVSKDAARIAGLVAQSARSVSSEAEARV